MGYGYDGDERGYGGYGGFRPYVSVAVRRTRALKEMEARRKKGLPVLPVRIDGRRITTQFWGNAWCQNLERYGDYANRIPRGRTYVRNGSVVHLDVAPGEVSAFVMGSELYTVNVKVSKLPAARWAALRRDCVGTIDSLVELLRGEFDAGVMERVCRAETGLFPSPREIDFECSCPDYADMCKHIAAVLYGVGARLDRDPEVLFRLRAVSAAELVAGAGEGAPLTKKGPAKGKVLAQSDVAGVFGVELDAAPAPAPKKKAGLPAKARVSAKATAKATAKAKARAKATPRAAKPTAKRRGRKPAGDSTDGA